MCRQLQGTVLDVIMIVLKNYVLGCAQTLAPPPLHNSLAHQVENGVYTNDIIIFGGREILAGGRS